MVPASVDVIMISCDIHHFLSLSSHFDPFDVRGLMPVWSM